VKIWAELLDNENIGIYDDFFDLGGHSLLAVRLFAEIERVFGKMLSLSTLFKTPTLGQLADAISQNVSIPEDSSLVPIQTAGEKTPLFLIPPAASTSLLFINMVRKLDHDQPVYGLDPVGLYDNRPHLSTVEEMASYNIQEMQRIQPKGPYLIGGICFGVRVAYEMAQQIQRQGKEMGLLVVFDSSPPRLKPKVTFYLKRYFSSIASLLQKRNKAVAPKPKEYILANQIVRNGNLPENLDAKTQIILQTHEKARRRYFARKYKGPVALFQSEQVLHEKDVHSKWTNAIPNGIDYYTTIAGSSHYSLFFKEEHYKLLAKQLNHILLDFHANLKK
jgi:thioesterase domain-containing protein/acyl carrier protein